MRRVLWRLIPLSMAGYFARLPLAGYRHLHDCDPDLHRHRFPGFQPNPAVRCLGRGLKDWQWLFILEAIPALILGFVVMFALTGGPDQAKWLKPEQRDWLVPRLADERQQKEALHHYRLGETMRHPRVWLLTLVYFGQKMTGFGLVLFLPQIVSRFGGVGWNGAISALPFAAAAIAMVIWGLHSDRSGKVASIPPLPVF